MLNKKKVSSIVLTIVLSLSTTPLVFADKNTNGNVQEIAINNESNKSEKLENLNVQQLTEIRDKYIDQNVEYLNNFGETSTQDLQDRKDEILNSEWGLVSFFNKNYKNLTEKEKLIKQIKLIEYLNSKKDIMYSAGEYFNLVNEEYQLSQYLLQNGKGSSIISYENLEFLINNLEDLSKFVDYDIKEAIKHIDPSIKISLSQEQKSDLNNRLKKISSDNNVNPEIKNDIKELQGEFNIEKNELNQVSSMTAMPSLMASTSSFKTTASSYRQNALAYARKHGYTNGYYGSTNRKNNAPSPYHNFQKDGYGDCANFVSQCLRAGGVTFWEKGNDDNNKWFYYSPSKRAPSWAGARQFKLHWMRRVDYQTLTVGNTLSFLRPATPVSICRENGVSTHILIATDKHSNGYNFSYAAHSDEGDRTNLLKKLKGLTISYYKIYW